VPSNEEELVHLKNKLAENEVDLAKMKTQVDCVAEYISILEMFLFKIENKTKLDEKELLKESFSNIYSDFFPLFYFTESIKV
jgi:hypothetical protein